MKVKSIHIKYLQDFYTQNNFFVYIMIFVLEISNLFFWKYKYTMEIDLKIRNFEGKKL